MQLPGTKKSVLFHPVLSKTLCSAALALSLTLSPGVVMFATAAPVTASAPDATNVVDGQMTQIYEYTLPTGQKLYVKPDHTKPIVTIDTWVKTGSVNETQPINGVSHFLEHLLFKGTTSHKPGSIERILESKGAEFNAATSDDFTHYYITTATPYFEEAISLHSDMMLNANFPVNELTQERSVVQEEINRAMDNPQRQLYVTLSKLIYGDHGYALDTLGPKENIAQIPRESILDYYHYWYQPKHFATVVVGDVDPEKVKALVSQYFPTPGYVLPANYHVPTVGKPQPLTQPIGKVETDPKVSQDYFTLNFLGPSIDEAHDSYAMDIAMNVLGDGKSSRLYRRLIEQQPLATDVSAANMTQKYSGLLNINAQTKPENRQQVKTIIMDEVKKLVVDGITPEELAKAKTQVLKDFVFLNETTDGVAQSIGYNVTIGTLKDYTDYVAEVQKITLEDVQKAAQKYLSFDKAVVAEMLPERLKIDTNAENNKNLAMLYETRLATQSAIAQAKSAEPKAVVQAAHDAVQKLILPNGMTVLLKQNPGSQTVALKLFVKGGQLKEAVPGIAQLTAQMLLQGTESRTAEEISQELESKGMSLSANATEDYMEVSGDSMKGDIGELFLVLRDVLNHAQYSQQELDKQKELLSQSIAASRDNPTSLAFENLSLTMYPNHPYGNVGKRVEQNLNLIQSDTVKQFAHQNFVPQNTLAVVVGNFDPAQVRTYLSNLYDSHSASALAQNSMLPKVKNLPENEQVVENKDKQAATWIAKGWLVPSVQNPDHVPLKVLNSLLGSGMSSRLFVNLREKQGLAYVVSSYYPTRQDQSRFVLYIGTDPKNYRMVERGFTKEIDRLKIEPIATKELQDAKDKLAGNFALAHETNANQAYYLGLFEVLGVGYQFDTQFPRLVQEVRSTDIQRVAQKYFSQPSVTSVVKPKEVGASEPAAATRKGRRKRS